MIFVELCAGTAAITATLLGGRTLCPYLGGKSRQAAEIIATLNMRTRLSRIVLVDAGEFGRTLAAVLDDSDKVCSYIEAWYDDDDRALYERLRTKAPASNRFERAAAHLYLQARSYRGRPVAPESDRWKVWGFDPEYRLSKTCAGPNSHARGWATPRPVLAQRVRDFAALPWPTVDIIHGRAQGIVPIKDSACYIDPDYVGTVGYANGMPRADVIATAQKWDACGSVVGVSEKEPIAALGWQTRAIGKVRSNTLGATQEWLTYNRAAQ